MKSYVLRPLERNDLELRERWLNDPSTRAGMPLDGDYSLADTVVWYDRIKPDPRRTDLTLEFRGNAVAMGGLTQIVPGNRAELYAFVSPGARGQGHGRQLVEGLCSIAFLKFQLHRVYLWTFGTNVPAQKLYLDCGFRTEGVLRDHAVVDGIYVDRVAMGLLVSEWKTDLPDLGPTISVELEALESARARGLEA